MKRMIAAIIMAMFVLTQAGISLALRSEGAEGKGIGEAQAELHAAAATGKVLVVDDEVESRDDRQLLLSRRGYEVDTASNVTEAIDRIKEKNYDVVLADWNMPGGNGDKLIAYVTNHMAEEDRPSIIVLTGLSDDVRRAGFTEVPVLTKGGPMTEVYEAIDKAMSTKSAAALAVNPSEAPVTYDAGRASGSQPATATGKTVLIAEDSDSQRKRLENILQRQGYNVIAAKDGQEAVDILDSGKNVDLIVSDNEMPRLDGLTLRIYKARRGVPFIIVSGKELPDDLLRIYNVTAVLRKATRDYEDNLLATVKNIFNGQQHVQDGVAVVISQDATINLANIKQYVKPFGIEFKDVVRVATVEEIKKITEPIVVILNYPRNVLADSIKSYAEKNDIAIIEILGKDPGEVAKEVEQAV